MHGQHRAKRKASCTGASLPPIRIASMAHRGESNSSAAPSLLLQNNNGAPAPLMRPTASGLSS
jgi:hypothetical protein